MSKQKTTPWFDGEVKPVRDGVYERDYGASSRPLFCLFKHGGWRLSSSCKHTAASEKTGSMAQALPWRGLTSPSKEAA